MHPFPWKKGRNTKVIGELVAQHHAKLRVPVVYEDRSTRRVLVLEFIEGLSLRDATGFLNKPATRRAELAQSLFETIGLEVRPKNLLVANAARELCSTRTQRWHPEERLRLLVCREVPCW